MTWNFLMDMYRRKGGGYSAVESVRLFPPERLRPAAKVHIPQNREGKELP